MENPAQELDPTSQNASIQETPKSHNAFFIIIYVLILVVLTAGTIMYGIKTKSNVQTNIQETLIPTIYPTMTLGPSDEPSKSSTISFEGETCGGFTPRPKECFSGLVCEYPDPPTGIDTDFGTCVRKENSRNFGK